MTDRYGRSITYLRLSVTDRCNLRCRYCMPERCAPVHAPLLSAQELCAAVRAAASLGVRKVRITGGEPLVRGDIVSVCREIAAVDGIEEVCLTTNGTLLAQLAGPLRAAGVRRLNLSLDTLDSDKYTRITGCGRLADVQAGLEAALSAGFDRLKLNTVLLGGFNDDEIPALAALTREYPVDVRFIEWMPMDGGIPGGYTQLSGQAVLQALPEAAAAAPDDGVAQRFYLPGARGYVGLIRPVSAPFCGACDRIRLTADGYVKPCLHSGEEYPLTGLSEDGMRRVMAEAIANKPPCHGALDAAHRSRAGRTMNRIGG